MFRPISSTVLAAALLASGIAQESVRRVGGKDLPEQVRAYLSRLEGFGFSGAALVAKDGQVLVETAHGLADKKNKSPVRTDTIFDIGSVTKQFTAAAILVLESDGKLRVTDPLAKYLKGVPGDKAGITIHHLLTHTSGLAMGFGGDYEKVSREGVVKRAMASELQSPPGERHAYSNAGYSLLAAVVEVVSGQSFETFLRERLFRPAGMSESGYFFSGQAAGRLARGYEDGEDWGIGAEKAAATGGDFWNLLGNGGVHSTVSDLYKWMVALQQGKVLSKEARQKFFQPHVLVYADYRKSGSPLYYAYGWYVWKQPSGKTLIFHLGGNGVFNAAVRYHVDERALVIYASNTSEFHDPNYPVPAIERMLAGEAVQVPPVVVPLTQQQLAEYAGRYGAASGSVLSVEANAPFLKVQGEGQEAFSFVTSGRWQKDAALEALNVRTAEVVENSRTRKYAAMLKEYGLETTLERLAEFETSFWKKRHERHGGYVRTRILGTTPSRSRAFMGTTIVAIDFERGAAYREYLWTPEGKIGDLGPLSSAPSARYFPESAACFVRFAPAEAVVSSRICLEKDDKRGKGATVLQGERRVELKKLQEKPELFSKVDAALREKEPAWKVEELIPGDTSDPLNHRIILRSGRERVTVDIFVWRREQDARDVFTATSFAIDNSATFASESLGQEIEDNTLKSSLPGLGDENHMWSYRSEPRQVIVQFRKGNVIVRVDSPSEAVAKRFTRHVFEQIAAG